MEKKTWLAECLRYGKDGTWHTSWTTTYVNQGSDMVNYIVTENKSTRQQQTYYWDAPEGAQEFHVGALPGGQGGDAPNGDGGPPTKSAGPSFWQRTKNYWGNVGTTIRMTAKYFTGEGDEYESFLNDRVTAEMSKSSVIDKIRQEYYAKYKGQIDLTGTSYVGANGNFGLSGLWSAGINPIQQFVVGFRGSVYSFDGKTLWFYVTNSSSFKSLTYEVGPKWQRSSFAPMGNFYQTYMWSEPVNRPK